ncbi:protein kinase domain-containing protein [Planctomicrobium sp. SH664]|uniref:protein kinase domain-containing protein n=1 Tax=Planctomicrobium sp. SH664 TaxID=3448125 RepID=UPI003F5B5165
MNATAPTTEEMDRDRLTALRELPWTLDTQLPVPPQSVIEFSSRARKPNVTVGELSAVVECEPALTTELLRNVNSCMRGLKRKVDSVTQAIGLLGIGNSTTILLTSALSNAVDQVDSPLVATADFRRETVERSLFAREAARRVGGDPMISFTAAMLQDILLPVLTRRYQVEYHEYLHGGERSSLVDFEKERFGWTHAEVTARMLLDWGFSNQLVLSVLQHHDSPERMLVDSPKIPMAFPGAAAALLMDVLNQSPDGVPRLVDLNAINQRFHVMEVAADVDEAVKSLSSSLQHPVSLVHRLQNAMLNQIEQRRRQSIVPGRQFGNYVLEEKLKESSMGAIFRARHIRLKRPAAVKVLRSERTSQTSIAQFEQEVQLTSSLRHPNTVSIFDYGHTPDDLLYYAMELIDGLTLADLVKRDGPLPDGRVISLLKQACGSLSEAHDLHLIHRDIKPENIMVSCRSNHPDHVTVVDFGLVTSTQRETRTDNRTVVGTPLYISPEAALGRDSIDPRSDLYSLAAVGYYLLTGLPVFLGESVLEVLKLHMLSTPVSPTERCNVSVCPHLEALLMQCLQKNPDARIASAALFAEELSRCEPKHPWTREAGVQWWGDYNRRKSQNDLQDDAHDTLGATLVTTDIGQYGAILARRGDDSTLTQNGTL